MSRRGARTRRPIRSQTPARHGFTLPELMIVMAIFVMVMAALISSHVFGLTVLNVTETQIGATDVGRQALDLLVADIRSGKTVAVGSGTLTTFTNATSGSAQQGGAMQINTSTNTNYYIRYYLDSTDKSLKRMTNGLATPVVVAYYLSNTVLFAAEDYSGTVLTNQQNNAVVHVTLQFYGLKFPDIAIGTNQAFSSYQVQTRIAVRAAE